MDSPIAKVVWCRSRSRLNITGRISAALCGASAQAAMTSEKMAEQMAEQGFQTAMFAANTALAGVGLDRGFHKVRIAEDMTALRYPRFGDALAAFLGELDPKRPLFLFVNLIDAHDPTGAVDLRYEIEDGEVTIIVEGAPDRPPEAVSRFHTLVAALVDRADLDLASGRVRLVKRSTA